MSDNVRALRRLDEKASTGIGAIEAAVRLATDDAVTSVHVVTRDRPTYLELLRLRHEALARGLNLSVSGGGVTLKRRKTPVARGEATLHGPGWTAVAAKPPRILTATPDTAAAAARTDREPWVSPLWQWLEAHGREWRAGLAALSEGTR